MAKHGWRVGFVIVMVVLLAGCGPIQKASAPQAPKPQAQSAANDELPPQALVRPHGLRTFLPGGTPPVLPSYLPLYSDAKVVGGFQRPSRFGEGGSVVYTSAAQPADIIAFYEKTSAAANFVQTINNSNGGTLSFGARAGRRSLQVIAEPIAGGSHVQIFWAGAAPG